MYGEAGLTLTGIAPKEYERMVERQAKKALSVVEVEAEVAGIPWRVEWLLEVQPWRAILRVARARKCDAIVMASHGRGGLGGLILGSETARVLAHTKIPVLVTR
jgi:nucleotide-binding universal stress UspA family protein